MRLSVSRLYLCCMPSDFLKNAFATHRSHLSFFRFLSYHCCCFFVLVCLFCSRSLCTVSVLFSRQHLGPACTVGHRTKSLLAPHCIELPKLMICNVVFLKTRFQFAIYKPCERFSESYRHESFQNIRSAAPRSCH